MKNETILVIGASGVVGSEVVKNLKAAGHSIRTTTSKPSKDKNVVTVNLATGEGIRDAFEGVDRAFLMSPSGYGDQYQVLSPLIQESKRRGLKKVVLMSAFGANASESTPLRRSEVELEKSGLKYNIVRPNWFMQNFNTFWVHGIRNESTIALPVGDAKTSFIDTRDIGAVIAKLLTSEKYDNRAFDLTGAQALSHAEVAEEISSALDKKIVFKDIEPSVLRAGLLSAGVPVDYTDFLLVIMNYLKLGYNSAVLPTVKELLGREPISFKQYTQDYKNAFSAQNY